MALKIARMIALIALVISLFVTVDYGINLVNSLVPELQTDGIGYRSVLQSWFGTLDGPFPEARAGFLDAFATAAWVSFGIFAVNAVLAVFAWLSRD